MQHDPCNIGTSFLCPPIGKDPHYDFHHLDFTAQVEASCNNLAHVELRVPATIKSNSGAARAAMQTMHLRMPETVRPVVGLARLEHLKKKGVT